MKATLTEKQSKFLELLPMNETVDIATSEYSLNPIPSTGWKPLHRTSAQMITALMKKGYIEGIKFWRGATIKKII